MKCPKNQKYDKNSRRCIDTPLLEVRKKHNYHEMGIGNKARLFTPPESVGEAYMEVSEVAVFAKLKSFKNWSAYPHKHELISDEPIDIGDEALKSKCEYTPGKSKVLCTIWRSKLDQKYVKDARQILGEKVYIYGTDKANYPVLLSDKDNKYAMMIAPVLTGLDRNL